MQRSVLLASLLIVLPLVGRRARSEQVILDRFVQDFAANAMGGIRKVIRFERMRPDRSDTAILFLGEGSSTGLPREIEVQGPTGNDVHPVDSQGADCVLERTALVHQNGVVLLVDAVRMFDAATLKSGYSVPASFDLQVYRLQQGDDAAEPALVFRASGTPRRTRPLCSTESVQQAIAGLLQTIR